MPKTATATTETIYFVAHNGDDIVHYGKIQPRSEVSTGLPILEEFSSNSEAAKRAFELGYSFDTYDVRATYMSDDIVIYSDVLYIRTSEVNASSVEVTPDNNPTVWNVL